MPQTGYSWAAWRIIFSEYDIKAEFLHIDMPEKAGKDIAHANT